MTVALVVIVEAIVMVNQIHAHWGWKKEESRADIKSLIERGGFEQRERSFAPRAPVDLPTQPPYTAHVANLSFDATDDDLTDLFSNLKISKIRLVKDRETERSKGFGYVEFEDVESLKGALELSGESVQGRNIRVNIAEPRK